ncbi:MAG: hypothetical protein RDV48_13770 [Candidatus Eremiobacteraeota bacterium]|nr:hypothetical protein [Candidatus Eremiobacteraeota bacterium]
MRKLFPGIYDLSIPLALVWALIALLALLPLIMVAGLCIGIKPAYLLAFWGYIVSRLLLAAFSFTVTYIIALLVTYKIFRMIGALQKNLFIFLVVLILVLFSAIGIAIFSPVYQKIFLMMESLESKDSRQLLEVVTVTGISGFIVGSLAGSYKGWNNQKYETKQKAPMGQTIKGTQ